MATKDISDVQVVLAYLESKDASAGIPCIEGPGINPYPWPYTILERRTGQCFKVCWRAMERAEDRGYLDCGVNLRSGWVTDKGKALLAAELEKRRLTDSPEAADFLDELMADANRALETARRM